MLNRQPPHRRSIPSPQSGEELLESSADLHAAVDLAAGSWPLDDEQETGYLRHEYADELRRLAAESDLTIRKHDGQLISHPSIVRILPGDRAVRIDKKKVSTIRPTFLVVVASEEAAGLLRTKLAARADELDCLVLRLDALTERAHMPQDLFFALAKQIDWRLLARRYILRLASETYDTDGLDPAAPGVFEAIAAAGGVAPKSVLMDLRPQIEREVSSNSRMVKDFRVAVSHLCLREFVAHEYTGQALNAVMDTPDPLEPLERAARALTTALADVNVSALMGASGLTMRILHARGDLGPCLVVAPASLLDQWRREMAKWAPELPAMIIRGPATDREWQWAAPKAVTLVSYESLRADFDSTPSRRNWDLVIATRRSEQRTATRPATC